MKTIPSFQIDHNILKKGIYISRIDDDITTYAQAQQRACYDQCRYAHN